MGHVHGCGVVTDCFFIYLSHLFCWTICFQFYIIWEFQKGLKFSLPRVATEDLFKKQRGTLGHILVEFREVKLRHLDPGFSLLRINFSERRPATQPGKSGGSFHTHKRSIKTYQQLTIKSKNANQVSGESNRYYKSSSMSTPC